MNITTILIISMIAFAIAMIILDTYYTIKLEKIRNRKKIDKLD